MANQDPIAIELLEEYQQKISYQIIKPNTKF